MTSPAEALQAPQEALDVANGSVAIIPLDAPALDERVTDDVGQEHEVIAWIDLPADSYEIPADTQRELDAMFGTLLSGPRPPKPGTRVAVCREGSGKSRKDSYSFVEFCEGRPIGVHKIDGKPSDHSKTSGAPTSPRTGDRTTDFTYSAGISNKVKGQKGSALVVEFRGTQQLSLGRGYNVSPTVTGPAVEVREGAMHDLLHTGNRAYRMAERLKTTAKLALGAVAVYATLASGGLFDHAAEGLNDARVSTEQRLDNFQERPLWMRLTEEVRGENKDDYHACVDRVAQTMADLDANDHAAIEARAEAFEHKYGSELMSAETVKDYHTRLEAAQTPDEAMAVLSDFMGFFNKKAHFLTQDLKNPADGMGFEKFDPATSSVDDVRWIVAAFIDTFSYLPKRIVENGNFTAVEIAGGATDWALGGVYHRTTETDGVLTFPTLSAFRRALKAGVNILPDAFSDSNYMTHNILHEFGHSWDWAGDTYSYESADDKPSTFTYMLSRLIDMPTEQSIYTATDEPGSEVERRADNFGSALEVLTPNGLAHPDQFRDFISPANTERLRIVTEFEAMMPGFTDYLTSLRLNHYSAFRTPVVPFLATVG